MFPHLLKYQPEVQTLVHVVEETAGIKNWQIFYFYFYFETFYFQKYSTFT